MLGGVVMVVVAYLWGAPALVTATAVTALVIDAVAAAPRDRRLRQERHRRRSSRSIYVPFLGSFVALMLAEGGSAAAAASTTRASRASSPSSLVTIASDIGGYVAGVLFGKHPMAPVISPEEVLGGLRRLGRLLRRRSAGRWSSTCSTATGGSASCSA